jgi:hypothetical protein
VTSCLNYNHVTECRGITGLLHGMVRVSSPIIMTINIGTTTTRYYDVVGRSRPVELM